MLFVIEILLKASCYLVLKGPYTIVAMVKNLIVFLLGIKRWQVGYGDTEVYYYCVLGQGYSGLQAAMLGVYIHGRAGDCLANDAYTIIPSKLIDVIPQTMLQMIYEKNDLS
ncbi:MAG: hypothetical protein ACLUIS_02175 [Longibaculum sp.]